MPTDFRTTTGRPDPRDGGTARALAPRGRTERLTSRRNRIGWRSVLVGVALWCVLWGQIDLLTILGGLAVTAGIAVLFPLPAIRYRGRIRPWGVVRLLAVTTADLVVSSTRVALLAADWRRPVRSAVVGVRLRTNSDLLIAMIIQLIGLVPGSVVVEHIRTSSRLYVHVLDVRDASSVDEAREMVRTVERRVLRAFGTDDEVAALEQPLEDEAPDAAARELPAVPPTRRAAARTPGPHTDPRGRQVR